MGHVIFLLSAHMIKQRYCKTLSYGNVHTLTCS